MSIMKISVEGAREPGSGDTSPASALEHERETKESTDHCRLDVRPCPHQQPADLEAPIETKPRFCFPTPRELLRTDTYLLAIGKIPGEPGTRHFIELPGNPALYLLRRHAAELLRERLLAAASPALADLEDIEISEDGLARLTYGSLATSFPADLIFQARPNPARAWRAEQALRLLRALKSAHAHGLVHGRLGPAHLALANSGQELRLIGLGAAMLRLPELGQPFPTRLGDLRDLKRLIPQLLLWTIAPSTIPMPFPTVVDALTDLDHADPSRRVSAIAALEVALDALAMPLGQTCGLDLNWYKLRTTLRSLGMSDIAFRDSLSGRLRGRKLPPTADKPRRYELFTPTLRLYLLPSRAEHRAGDLFVAHVERAQPDARDVNKLIDLFVDFDEQASSRHIWTTLDAATPPERLDQRMDDWQGYAVGQFVLEREAEDIEANQHLRVRYERVDDGDGDHAVLTFTRAVRWNDEDGSDLGRRWREAFLDAEDISLRREGQPVGRGTAWDDDKLRVALDHRAELPNRGELEIINWGRQTLLDRGRRAMRALRLGRAANPHLPWVFVDPARARVGESVPVSSLYQNLQPAVEVQDLLGRMLGAPDLFTLQGPPGAGKTTTITELILHEIARNPRVRILVTSQSRAAVANVFTRLDDLRQDQAITLPRDFLTYRDDRTQAQSPEFTTWASEVRKRSAAAGHPALKEWRGQVATQAVEDEYLRAVNVYGATLMRLPRLLQRLSDLDAFDLVIVDEAARATLSELMVAALRGTRVILVGDHKQLPPHLEDLRRDQLRAAGFEERDVKRSLFEELFTGVSATGKPGLPATLTHTLDIQYRMHPSIASIVSRAFYGGKLATGPLGDRALNVSGLGGQNRAFWLNLRGQPVQDGTSWRNAEQAQAVRRLLQRLDRQLGGGRAPQSLSVAVICAYRSHVREVRRGLQGLTFQHLEIVVNTVDAFQGQERDVIVYASGRALTASAFVSDPQRLNVAFSRAKRLLVVIGDRRASLDSGQLKAVAPLFKPLPAPYPQEVQHATPAQHRDDRQHQGPRAVLAVDGGRGAEPARDTSSSGKGGPRRRGRRRPNPRRGSKGTGN